MSPTDKTPIQIPTLKELQAIVVVRKTPPVTVKTIVESDPGLSKNAERFLRHAALNVGRECTLEDYWEAIGVTNGSAKNAVLSELRGKGLIRLEKKGRNKRVHLYAEAWRLLDIKPPKGMGAGGATHKECVQRAAGLFRSKGYDVRIEQPVGPKKKRVDLVAYGKHRIGVEVGLTDISQELKNLREDLQSGALDMVVFVTTMPGFLEDAKARAARDSYLKRHSDRIRFFLLEDD